MQKPIFTGFWGNCHIQGIAVDQKNGYIYYSFTTKLIKAKLDGTVVGSVCGLVGHLGCIAFCEADGCVYGSLEYKNDIIGKNILRVVEADAAFPDGFYVVKFDGSKIDRMEIPAERSDIMSAVYLKEVVEDYNATGAAGAMHKYGCSGIDGVTFAPLPGGASDGRYLYVAYGIYSEPDREDNDRQVLLCYDLEALKPFWKPLDQTDMHHSGPQAPLHKFFVYTGNTRYGVQNLEYDPFTGAMLMAVYKGEKSQFPNYRLFAVELANPPKTETLGGEAVQTLPLKAGILDKASGVRGWHFPYGSTGLYSFGNGHWFISHGRKTESGHCANIYPYTWDGESPFVCDIPIEA